MFVLEITILNLLNTNWRMFRWLSTLCSECHYLLLLSLNISHMMSVASLLRFYQHIPYHSFHQSFRSCPHTTHIIHMKHIAMFPSLPLWLWLCYGLAEDHHCKVATLFMYLYPAHLATTATQLLPSGREIGHISPSVGNKAQQVALLSEYFASQTRGVCNSITLHPAVMHCSSQLPSPAPVYSPHTRCTKMHSRHCSPRSPYFLVIQNTRKTKQDATFSTLE